jgi:hypothetical protein
LNNLNLLLREWRCTVFFRRCLRFQFLFQQQVKSVFNESALLGDMPPDLRILATTSIHGRKIIPKVPALCALEAYMRGAFTLLLPRLRPYCFSKGNVVFHPALGTHREMFFLTTGAVTCATTVRPRHGTATPRSLDKFFDRFTGGKSTAPVIERYDEGEFFGEVPMLIPEEEQFNIKVEVRCATANVQAFGLTRTEYAGLRANYRQFASSLGTVCRQRFEANFHDWVTVSSKDFEYEEMCSKIGLRRKVDVEVAKVFSTYVEASVSSALSIADQLQPTLAASRENRFAEQPSQAQPPEVPRAEAQSSVAETLHLEQVLHSHAVSEVAIVQENGEEGPGAQEAPSTGRNERDGTESQYGRTPSRRWKARPGSSRSSTPTSQKTWREPSRANSASRSKDSVIAI